MQEFQRLSLETRGAGVEIRTRKARRHTGVTGIGVSVHEIAIRTSSKTGVVEQSTASIAARASSGGSTTIPASRVTG